MWFSVFFFLILSLIVEVYVWWKLQASLIFLSGRTCTIGGWLNTFLPHCKYIYIEVWVVVGRLEQKMPGPIFLSQSSPDSDNKQICATAHFTKLKISITDIWTKSHSDNLLLFRLNKFIIAICALDGNGNLEYWTALSCHLDGFSVCTFVFFSVQRLIVPVSLADNSVYEREGQRSGMWIFQVHIISYNIPFYSLLSLLPHGPFFSINFRSFFKWHQRLLRLLTQWSAWKHWKTLIILLQWAG